MITQKEVQHIAKLARLSITKKEEEKLRRELSSILDYVSQLKRVETGAIQPVFQTRGLKNIMREDKRKIKNQISKIKSTNKLLKTAPEIKDRYLKVKAIFPEI